MKILITLLLYLPPFTLIAQNFHTEYTYNQGITIQNSYPKGGHKYINPNGKTFTYAVFWTCITNNTNSNLELLINFNSNAFKIPSSPNINFHLYIPNEDMRIEKISFSNYGLDLKSFLDKNFGKPSELIKTIHPNDSYGFYTVALSNKGVNGVIRAGFDLHNQDLSYTINDYRIPCGRLVKD